MTNAATTGLLDTPLQTLDPEIHAAIEKEYNRQQNHIELIASENFTLPAIMEATASVMTNKYAEGYPGKRYYGGCEYVDIAESLAIDRAKKVFGADHANVQPHSGSQANAAVYQAFLKPGDKILAMSLQDGGHLTHGHPKNFSGLFFEAHHYGVHEETGLLNYEQLEELAERHKPKMIIAGASAYSRTIDFERIGKIAKSCNALLLVDMAHIAGLVAAGCHPSPFPHADIVTTTTHKTLRGPRGGLILCKEEFAQKIDSAVFPGQQGGPLMHIIAAKAVCFGQALTEDFKRYQEQVVKNAKVFASELSNLGYFVVSGGTDNHLCLIDLRKNMPDINGKQAQTALDSAHITTNRNTVPGETRSPFQTSGLRLGTPAVTSRGMQEEEMRQIVHLIHETLEALTNQADTTPIKEKVIALTNRFPLPYKA